MFNNRINSLSGGLSYSLKFFIAQAVTGLSRRVNTQRLHLRLPTSVLSYAFVSLFAKPVAAWELQHITWPRARSCIQACLIARYDYSRQTLPSARLLLSPLSEQRDARVEPLPHHGNLDETVEPRTHNRHLFDLHHASLGLLPHYRSP